MHPILLIRLNTFFDGIIGLGCGATSSIAGLLPAHLLVFLFFHSLVRPPRLPKMTTEFVCIIFPSIFLFPFYSDSDLDSEHGGTTITDMYAEANVIFCSGVYL